MPGSRVQVAVVGGGLAGLFCASELVGRGVEDVVVVDRAVDPGGMARTVRRDGYALEPAAGTLLLPHPHLSPLLERAGAKVAPAEPEAALRYVYTRGRLVAVPSSPKALFAPLVPLTAKLRGMLEPILRGEPGTEEESLDAFLRRRFGDRLGEMLAWLAASGVYAGDPERLSARASFPGLTALEDDAGSILIGGLQRLLKRPSGAVRPTTHLPDDGMSGLAEAIAASLGDRWQGGLEVVSVTESSSGWRLEGAGVIDADQVVLAMSPPAAGELVGGELADVLSRSVSAPVVVVGLGGQDVSVPAGFGALCGPDAGMVTRGVLFESSYAPGRAPRGHGLVKVIAGGAIAPHLVDEGDDRILETVVAEAERILGVGVGPAFTAIVRHQPGIPQYELGHREWLAEVDRILTGSHGLYLTGWGYRGVGVAHLATDAVRLASQVVSKME